VPLSPGPGEQVALQYSGAAEGKPLPMVLETVADSVNRGACILHLSQYPKEVEYLYPPMSFIAAAGTPRFAISEDGLGVRVFPVQVSANQASRTVEQILGQKKRAHIAAFRFLVAETRAELARIADTDGAAAARLAGDSTKNQGGTHTVEGLLERIVRQVEEVVERHEAVGEGEYADDAVFQGLVTGMLDARRWAVSKLRLWLEDHTEYICLLTDYSLREAHRLLSAHLVRAAGAAAGTEDGRRAAAAACMERRLLQARVDEANDEGETPLVAAAADGAAAADIRLIVAAGSAVNGAEGEPSAAAVQAARFGHADALRALLEAKADLNSSEKVLYSCSLKDQNGTHATAMDSDMPTASFPRPHPNVIRMKETRSSLHSVSLQPLSRFSRVAGYSYAPLLCGSKRAPASGGAAPGEQRRH
jgi:hypothetical protein